MEYCIPFFSWFACGGVNIYNFIIGLFFPITGLPLHLLTLVISSVFVFIMAKVLGKIGGVILMILGIAGSLFTFGISLLLTFLGTILLIYEKAWPLVVMLNIISVVLCIVCYVL